MGSVTLGPPTISRPSLTQESFFNFLSSVTKVFLCSSLTSERNLKRTVRDTNQQDESALSDIEEATDQCVRKSWRPDVYMIKVV